METASASKSASTAGEVVKQLHTLSVASSQQSALATRKNLAVLIRVLLQYLSRVDRAALERAKEALRDCKRKHDSKDSKFASLAEAIQERVRNEVGEGHWAQARAIHKQLCINKKRQRLEKMLKLRRASERSVDSPINSDVVISRRIRMKKRSSSSDLSPDSDSSTSSMTVSGNEKGTPSTAGTASTAPSTSGNTHRTSSSSNKDDNSRYSSND